MDSKDRLELLKEEAIAFYSSSREIIMSIVGEARNMKLEDLADSGFLLREIEKRFEEIRKDVKVVREAVDKALCIRVTFAAAENPDLETIKGELASATPKMCKCCQPPREGTPEYESMMNYFGIDTSASQGVAKLSFTELEKFVTLAEEDGRKLPDFFPDTFNKYTVAYRKR